MPRVEVDTPINHAFIADEAGIRKLVELMSQAVGGAATINAECADRMTVTFPTTEELMAFSNPAHRGIKDIRISAIGTGEVRSAYVSLDSNWSTRPISIRASGSEAHVIKLERDLRDHLSTLRPWYSSIAALPTWLDATLFVAIMMGLILTVVGVIGLIRQEPPTPPGFASVLFVLVAFCVLLSVRSRLFPRGAFLIGHGRTRQQRLEKLHSFIGFGVIATIILGVITDYISQRILSP